MNLVKTLTWVSLHSWVWEDIKHVSLSEVLLNRDRSWCAFSWLWNLSQRCCFSCSCVLLQMNMKDCIHWTLWSRSAIYCQWRKIWCISLFIILIIQCYQHQWLPPESLNFWLCLWWGHIDWEWDEERHIFLLLLKRYRMSVMKDVGEKVSGDACEVLVAPPQN